MASYPLPIPNSPIYNSTSFATHETSLTQQTADKRYCRFPSSQGYMYFQGANFSSDVSFNGVSINGVATLTTNPVANDNSQQLATTSWTQSLVSSIPSTPTTYPQVWVASLYKSTASGNAGEPTWAAQDVDVVLPFANNLGTSNTIWGYTLYVKIFVSNYGRYSNNTGQIINNTRFLTNDTTIAINLNLTQSQAIVTTSTLVSSGDVLTSQTIQYAAPIINPVYAGDSINVTPCAINVVAGATNRNRIRFTFNSLVGTNADATRRGRPTSMIRKLEIIAGNLNSWTSSGNSNNWNTMTYPNAGSNGTVNMPPYIVPVSTNSY